MENVIKKSVSALIMKSVYIENMHFKRRALVVSYENTDMDVQRTVERLEDGSFKVTLTMTIEDKQEDFVLGVTVCGIFTLEDETDETIKKASIAKNTVAILFPYLRSQITLLTSQPDMKPIVLPAVNINSLLENMEDSVRV